MGQNPPAPLHLPLVSPPYPPPTHPLPHPLPHQTITDLLDPTRVNLAVRENLEGQYVSNLTAHEVYRGERGARRARLYCAVSR